MTSPDKSRTLGQSRGDVEHRSTKLIASSTQTRRVNSTVAVTESPAVHDPVAVSDGNGSGPGYLSFVSVDHELIDTEADTVEYGVGLATERIWSLTGGVQAGCGRSGRRLVASMGVTAIGCHEAVFELHSLPPFRLDLTAWALRRRPRNRMDTWDGRYRRALIIDGAPIAVEVLQIGPVDAPELVVTVSASIELTPTRLCVIQGVVERLLGLGIDLNPFYALADADPHLRVLKDRFLGVKPPRFPTVFEGLANAIANQQLTLEVGIELLNRLTNTYGLPAPSTGGPLYTFPEARVVADVTVADLRGLGFSASKARYLIGLAGIVSSGGLDLDELDLMSREGATRNLQRLHGIGRWSAEYVLLRGLGRLEVFPGDDVGARNKLQQFLNLPAPPSYAEILAILAPWYPYAGMVYFHLLLDGLVERGALEI